jgi:sterol desaturase/sphingolipid hydroxylase (fatty acid hydroxylase superfamily)
MSRSTNDFNAAGGQLMTPRGESSSAPAGSRLRRTVSALVYPTVLFGATLTAMGLIQITSPLEAMASSLALVIVALAACERLLVFRPAWRPGRSEIASDLAHAAVNAAVPGGVQVLLVALYGLLDVGATAQGLEHAQWLRWPHRWSLGAQVLLAIAIGELGVYWAHRAAHAWLWRFHAVHHAVSKLNWLNGVHFHPMDIGWMQLVSMAPLLLLGASPEALAVYAVFAQTGTFLQHCNVELRLGVMNRVFNTPDYHRWHHSPDRFEANHNYGGALIIWDIVFGTRFLPSVAPHPELGSRGRSPQTYLGQLVWPFARRS